MAGYSDYDWPEGHTEEEIAAREAMARVVDAHGGYSCHVRAVVEALFAEGYRLVAEAD
jgi:hypothetical protein